MTDTPQEQPTTGQDQQVTPNPTPQATPPAAPAAPTPAAGPWATDLAALFPDEATRNEVDQFLRSKVQPYTTQLEQKAAVSESASRLWNDLESNPIDAYVAITTELFGEEAGTELLQAIQTRLESTPAEPNPAQPPEQVSDDPRVAAMYESFIQNQAESAYDEGLARIQADANTQDIDTDLIHPFVAAAGGDFDQAVVMYRQFYEQFQSKLAPGEESQAPPAPPPAVGGSDTGGTAQPSSAPTEPRAQTLDEAINSFMDEQRANREAPPVGAS